MHHWGGREEGRVGEGGEEREGGRRGNGGTLHTQLTPDQRLTALREEVDNSINLTATIEVLELGGAVEG